MKESEAPANDTFSDDYESDSSSFEDENDENSEELKNEEAYVTDNLSDQSKEEQSQEQIDSTYEKRFVAAMNNLHMISAAPH